MCGQTSSMHQILVFAYRTVLVRMQMKNLILPMGVMMALCGAVVAPQAKAATLTLATNGNVGAAADWDGTIGGPGAFPNASNHGSITAAAVVSQYDLSAAIGTGGINITNGGGAVTITQGTGSSVISGGGAKHDFGIYVTSGTLNYTIIGGNLEGQLIRPGNNTTLTLAGGTISGPGRSGERIFPQGNGSFVMTSGTVNSLGLEVGAGGSAILTGGAWTNMGANNSFDGIFVNSGGTVSIGGSVTFNINTGGAGINTSGLFAGAGTITFDPNWSGNVTTTGGWALADWQTALTVNGNVYVGSTLLTASNVSNYAVDTTGVLTLKVPTDYLLNATIPNSAGSDIHITSTGTIGDGDTTVNIVGLSTTGTTGMKTLSNAYTAGTSVTVDITNIQAQAGPATYGAANILRLGATGIITSATGSDLLTLGSSVAEGGSLTAGGAGNTAGTLAFAATNDILVNAAIIDNGSGVVAVTKTGIGTLTLAGTNTNTGTTTITQGTLQVGNGGTTGSLGSGAITNNATLAFNRSNAMTVSNIISGTGAITQIGSGTTTLSGANTYTGTTTVSGGTLLVNKTHNAGVGAYTVDAGGKLGGTGTINTTGAVTIDGQITGGDFGTVGTLSIAGAGSRVLAGTYLFDVNYATLTGDVLSITGATSVNITAGTFTLGTITAGSIPTAGSNYRIKLFESNVAVAGASAGQSNLTNVSGLAPGQSIVTWDGGKSYYLVPEPASAALLSLGCLLLLRRPTRRRGRKTKA